MIDVQHLTKKFGDLTAVDNLSSHADEGEVFGLPLLIRFIVSKGTPPDIIESFNNAFSFWFVIGAS